MTTNPRDPFWKKLGLTVAKWADATFLYGVGQLASDMYRVVLEATGQHTPPLDWDYPFATIYTNEVSVLWINNPEKQRVFLPQTLVISSLRAFDESSISLELEPSDFHAPFSVEEGFEFYRRSADGGIKQFFFNGENARLLHWDIDSRKFVFQGCSYFDYLKTNLALDVPMPTIGSLREHLVTTGQIEPLSSSKLANATGLNGLVFSNDGHMIFQRRRDNVLVRPRELCSGFSGTIDKIDIENATKAGGYLIHLDVLREMVEELGIRRSEVSVRRFLGLTRELIRGGTPEMFYAVEVDLPVREIMSRISRDREGVVKSCFFGPYATARIDSVEARKLSQHFWSLLTNVQQVGDGPVSVPLLTNLVLWYQQACPHEVGASSLPDVLRAPTTIR